MNDPKNKIKSTYAQVTKNRHPINLEEIKPEDIFELISLKTVIKAKAISKENL